MTATKDASRDRLGAARKPTRILLPVDFTEASDQVVDRAAALAIREGAELRLFHALVPSDYDPPPIDRRRSETEARIEHIRSSWSGSGDASKLRVGFDTSGHGSVFAGIMAEVESYRPDLIVMPTHRGGIFVGSVAERVVRHAPCAVLTCRSRAQGRWPLEEGRMVVPVDFSTDSRRALEMARTFETDQSPITLVHVVEAPDYPSLYADKLPKPFARDASMKASIEEHLRDWAEGPVDEVIAVEGKIRTEVIRICRELEAVLVVIGTHGWHTVSQRWVGSTAERLTREAPTPVLTVR